MWMAMKGSSICQRCSKAGGLGLPLFTVAAIHP